jgi:hypothetical protein
MRWRPIVEDEFFAALEPDLSPRLAALGGLSRAIRTGHGLARRSAWA